MSIYANLGLALIAALIVLQMCNRRLRCSYCGEIARHDIHCPRKDLPW